MSTIMEDKDLELINSSLNAHRYFLSSWSYVTVCTKSSFSVYIKMTSILWMYLMPLTVHFSWLKLYILCYIYFITSLKKIAAQNKWHQHCSVSHLIHSATFLVQLLFFLESVIVLWILSPYLLSFYGTDPKPSNRTIKPISVQLNTSVPFVCVW